jgi:hypothetical protein
MSGNLGASNSWNSQGLSSPEMGLLYLSENIKETVLHTIHAEAVNIKASYASTSFIMMQYMESNWMTQTEQQMEKNSFGNFLVMNAMLYIHSKVLRKKSHL